MLRLGTLTEMGQQNSERRFTAYSSRFQHRHGARVRDRKTGMVGNVAARFSARDKNFYTLLQTGNALFPETDLGHQGRMQDFFAQLLAPKNRDGERGRLH